MADLLKMKITPESSGYTGKDGSQVLSARLDGGGSRYRQDVAGATAIVSVKWHIHRGGYEYLRAFYQLTGAKGLPFTIALIMDEAFLTEHQAWFVPDSMQLDSQSGLAYWVSATLEVVPLSPDDALAQVIIDNYVGSPEPQMGSSSLPSDLALDLGD